MTPDTDSIVSTSMDGSNQVFCLESAMFRDLAQRQLTDAAFCRAQLFGALRQLHAQPSLVLPERCFRLIWSTLSSQARLFHSADHVLSLSQGGDAIHTLAALFHDAVYVQIDGGLTAPVQLQLAPYMLHRGGQLYLKGLNELQHCRRSAMVAELFGFRALTPQPASEHNELLSALLSVCCLEPLLGWGDLAQIAVTIEASIPFRQATQSADARPQRTGLGTAEQLLSRLQRANQRFDLALDDITMARAIHRAVAFANRDVESFATTDPSIFLSHTWQLLPEFNPALRDPMRYSVQDYREALRGMESFIQHLDAESIFRQFRQSPNASVCQHWKHQAQQNLSVAQLYLQTKIVAIALLEALGPFYGGGGAMAAWMSPRPDEQSWQDSFKPWSLSHPLSVVEQQVLQVAEQGREGACHFDLNRSPLSAFLIRAIGFERIGQLRQQADALFDEHICPEDFLNRCEAKVVQAVTRRLRVLT